MIWELVYTDDARGQLTELLARADAVVILAAARANAVLMYCPRSFGESRDTGERLGFELPLAVRYEIDDARREVRVLGVKRVDHPADGDEPADPEDDRP